MSDKRSEACVLCVEWQLLPLLSFLLLLLLLSLGRCDEDPVLHVGFVPFSHSVMASCSCKKAVCSGFGCDRELRSVDMSVKEQVFTSNAEQFSRPNAPSFVFGILVALERFVIEKVNNAGSQRKGKKK